MELYRASDFEEASGFVESILQARYLRPLIPNDTIQFVARVERICEDIRIAQYAYGVPIEVDLGWPQHYYLLVPLRGTCRFASPGGTVTIGQGQAAFVAPSVYLRTRADDRYERLIVRMDRLTTEAYFGWDEINDTRLGAIRFIDLNAAEAASLQTELAMFVGRLAGERDTRGDEQQMNRLCRALRPLVDPSFSELRSKSRSRADSVVGRAEAFMRRCCGDEITLNEVADYVRQSHRSMFAAFQAVRSYGPYGYLRHVRLAAARIALCRERSDRASVTKIAGDYGFNHLGRFSVEYRQQFGESPSETLGHRRHFR